MVTLNGREVVVGSIEVTDVDTKDYPDFCDAYIEYATFIEGTVLTEDETIQLQDENPDLVNELAFESILGRI